MLGSTNSMTPVILEVTLRLVVKERLSPSKQSLEHGNLGTSDPKNGNGANDLTYRVSIFLVCELLFCESPPAAGQVEEANPMGFATAVLLSCHPRGIHASCRQSNPAATAQVEIEAGGSG